jgi:ABC-type polysaccharide/polyol phosphate transport system ATPase subunit
MTTLTDMRRRTGPGAGGAPAIIEPMSTGGPAIVVQDVSKTFLRPHEQMHTLKERALHPFRGRSFDHLDAVRDVSFSIDQGEFFGIVGRNGSGKSTLLKLIAGIYQASSGEIWVNGRMSTFIELGVGFNPDLAARDNVILNGIMLGLTPAEARERYEQVIDFAELRESETVKLKNYSSGMHVRLAFSVMIQVDADVLLIDEVLAVGDASFQQKCFDQFNRLRDAGKTIVLVTHDMSSVRRFCHRAMLMEHGETVLSGDPERVGSRYLELNFHHDHEGDADEDPDRERYGDGSARFMQLWTQTPDGLPLEAAAQGTDIVVKAVAEFQAAIADPVVGITVENEDRQPVFAANSIWVEERTGSFQAGDRALLTVTFPNVLAPGRYFITPHMARRGSGLDLIDRHPRMISFLVTGTRDSGGIVELDHDLRFERTSSASEAVTQ